MNKTMCYCLLQVYDDNILDDNQLVDLDGIQLVSDRLKEINGCISDVMQAITK